MSSRDSPIHESPVAGLMTSSNRYPLSGTRPFHAARSGEREMFVMLIDQDRREFVTWNEKAK